MGWGAPGMGDRSGKWKGGLRAGPAGGAPLGESMSLPSAPRLPTAGELYDLDASSLQLKVLQYVSARASPPPPVVLQGPRALLNQIPAPRPPFLPPEEPRRGERVGSGGGPRSAVSLSLGPCLSAAAGNPGISLLPPAGVRGQSPAFL